MARDQTPLNVFRTKALALTDQSTTIYTTPEGITGIVLGALASNIGTSPATVTMVLRKNSTDYTILNSYTVPPYDASDLTTGKLVLEEGTVLKAFSSANNSMNLVLSILETTND
jgi:hypothetical protein